MSTQRWIGGNGQGLTWSSALNGTELNSLANGNAVLIATQIDNTTALDVFADFSYSLGSVTTTGTAPFLALYFYPLNEDGTTYGDGRFGSAATGPPSSNYLIGYAGLPVGAQVLTGLFSLPGMFRTPISLPPAKGKLVLHNGAGVGLAASSNTIAYRTYNLSVA